MGIGSDMFGLEAGLIVMAVNLQMPLMGALVIPLHFFNRWLYRKDAILVKAYLKYMKQADMYDPWVRRQVSDKRPKGFGRGLNC